MLKIQSIEYMRTVYDESISHNIFSIANITFSNAAPIFGALLFWKKNEDDAPYTPQDEYKFFYDMANIQYFASVKFPKGTDLTKEQRQELAYILLEQRGSAGSYSFSSTPKERPFNPERALQKLRDDDFDGLAAWHAKAVLEHHSKLLPVLPYIDFSILCRENHYLSEQFLIDHYEQVDWDALQYNYPVLARLSKAMKQHLVEQLQAHDYPLQPDIAEDVDYFIEASDFYSEYEDIYLPEADEVPVDSLEHFEYERGTNIWSGSDHLITGIPSLYAQQYDRYGDRRATNEEMAEKIARYSPVQKCLFSMTCELHWLAQFANEWDWDVVCEWNEQLTEPFLMAFESRLHYPNLGLNSKIKLSEQFIQQHMTQFNLQQPVPLVICHLTEQFYLANKDVIIVDRSLLLKYSDAIDSYEYMLLEDLID